MNPVRMFLRKNIIRFFITGSLAILLPGIVSAQHSDTAANAAPRKKSSFLHLLSTALTKKMADTAVQTGMPVSNIEAQFQPYAGMVIRQILVHKSGLDKKITDTTPEPVYFGKDFISHLHKNTREWVVRNNLFIKEKSALNPILVADNERYLRSLDYLYDARILARPVTGSPDSVDLIVLTRDFISLIAELNDLGAGRFKAKAGDANFMGTGQKIRLTTQFQKNRDPHFGAELYFRNNNVAGTFINVTVGYSTIAPDLADHTPDEKTLYALIERPLVSQYLHVAGALKLARNQTFNNYGKPDSLFCKYRSNSIDAWFGYNLGIRKFLFLKSVKNRHFIGLRYFRNQFDRAPYQLEGKLNFRFNNRQALLAQYSFFRQTIYKTNFLFGFGITEDVPLGYNIALTGGWYKQAYLERPYAGLDANRYIVSNRGHVLQYFLRTGTFLNQGKLQDAAVLVGASAFSRIITFKNLKMRQYVRASFTQQFNRTGLDPLDINNIFGFRYLPTDSVSGNQRSSLHSESIFFLKYRLLGFKFAPFVSADMVYIRPLQKKASGFYMGLGGGIRTRHEDLLLGTIELRFMYFIPKSQQYSAFKITLITQLRFRSNFNYVNAPEIIQVNSDNNTIY